MYVIRIKTQIDAPAERCFDLARSIEAHLRSSADTDERVVDGRTSGLMELGDSVTWEARHLGVRQRLSGRITAFDRPGHFQDTMERGAFRSLVHDHSFEAIAPRTTMMTDTLRFAAPYGPLGWIAERLVIGPHLRSFLVRRGAALKAMAEHDDWRAFLPAE